MRDEPEDPGGSSTIDVDDRQALPVDADALASVAAGALAALAVTPQASLSIGLVDAEAMAELKLRALGVRAPTDVLSFPIDDPSDPSPGPMMLGDIVLCPAVAARNAATLGRALDDELRRLLVHGLLHVLGADHDDVASELAMAAHERSVLAAVREAA